MDFSFFIANAQGFIAVAIAGAIFYMGRLNGRRVGAVAAANELLHTLEEHNYIRVKKRTVLDNGDEQVEYARLDE
tara:strand:- start:321 stop:545 length:225 start_codon:yes stop_codon:yes gene_type:complete